MTGTLTGGLRSDLVETAVSVVQGTVRDGGSLRVADTVVNRGGTAASRSTSGYYLSRNPTRKRGDVRLGGRAVSSLRPGSASRGSNTVSIPVTAAPGSYRVLACADDRARIQESIESNNCRAAAQAVEVVDRTPPNFTGLRSATTCIPGPIGEGRTAVYHLLWGHATDNVTPSSKLVYDVYQATVPGGEDFSSPTYTTAAGATAFATPPLSSVAPYYFVLRARDAAGNRDANETERPGQNLCV